MVRLLLGLGVVVGAGCAAFCVEGNGNVVIQSRVVEPFRAVRVTGGIDLRGVADGEMPERTIEVETDDNLLDRIETRVVEGTLVIAVRGTDCIDPSGPLVVFASLGEVEAIRIEGSGECVNEHPMRTTALDVEVVGSGGARLTDVGAVRLVTRVDGSGDAAIGGSAEELFVRLRGSGDVDASALDARHVRVELSGSGDVDVSASETLNGRVDGSGDVRYHGDAAVHVTVHGSGSVRPG